MRRKRRRINRIETIKIKLIKLINNENIKLESNHTVSLIKGETTW